jgi:hypothetical protein
MIAEQRFLLGRHRRESNAQRNGKRAGETCRVGTPPKTSQTFLPCYQTHTPGRYTRVVPEEESYTWNSLELCRTWLNSFCCVPTTLSVLFLPTLVQMDCSLHSQKKKGATPSNVNVCAPLSIDVFLLLPSVLSSSYYYYYEGRSHSKQCECLAVCVKQLVADCRTNTTTANTGTRSLPSTPLSLNACVCFVWRCVALCVVCFFSPLHSLTFLLSTLLKTLSPLSRSLCGTYTQRQRVGELFPSTRNK